MQALPYSYAHNAILTYVHMYALSHFSLFVHTTYIAALEATLEAPPRVTSPTYPSDYISGRRLPGNRRSLAVERRKKGEQPEGKPGEEEEEEEEEE